MRDMSAIVYNIHTTPHPSIPYYASTEVVLRYESFNKGTLYSSKVIEKAWADRTSNDGLNGNEIKHTTRLRTDMIWIPQNQRGGSLRSLYPLPRKANSKSSNATLKTRTAGLP